MSTPFTEVEKYVYPITKVINMETEEVQVFTVPPKEAVVLASMMDYPNIASHYKDAVTDLIVLEGAMTYTCGDWVAYKEGCEPKGPQPGQ